MYISPGCKDVFVLENLFQYTPMICMCVYVCMYLQLVQYSLLKTNKIVIKSFNLNYIISYNLPIISGDFNT